MLPLVRPWEVEKSGSHIVVQKQACLLLGLQSKTLAELEDIFTETAEAQELASGIGDAAEARQWLRTKLQAVGEKAGFRGVLGEALGRVGPLSPSLALAPTVSSPGLSAGCVPHSHSGICIPQHLLAPLSPGTLLLSAGLGFGCHHVVACGRRKREC